MKKVLSTVAALGLVAGLASTAAAVEFKMSGKYLVEGAYLSDARGDGVSVLEKVGESTPSDAYWLHTFEMKPTMKVNDKISMSSVIRLAQDSIWGTQDDTLGQQMSDDNNSGVYVHQLYMDYASPIGKVRAGRTPAGTYGTNFMDFDKRADRVMFWNDGLPKPLSTLFYIEKATDNTGIHPDETDSDSDTYVARIYYNTDTVDAGFHYGFTNNKTNIDPAGIAAVAVAEDGILTDLGTDGRIRDDQKHQFTAYGKFKMDNFFLNTELTHFAGDVDFDAVATTDVDYDSWAAMLQVGAKIDALTVSGTYFYAGGDDKSQDDEAGNALGSTGTGDMFEPLYILTGRHTGMLNNDIANYYTATMSQAGAHAFVLAADYTVSNQLSLHGAIGYAQADEEVRTNNAGVAATGSYLNRDDEYGWEYNVGAAYKLLDNLTYEAHFGYLDTGDFFNSSATTNDAENVYIMTHSLTMTF